MIYNCNFNYKPIICDWIWKTLLLTHKDKYLKYIIQLLTE